MKPKGRSLTVQTAIEDRYRQKGDRKFEVILICLESHEGNSSHGGSTKYCRNRKAASLADTKTLDARRAGPAAGASRADPE